MSESCVTVVLKADGKSFRAEQCGLEINTKNLPILLYALHMLPESSPFSLKATGKCSKNPLTQRVSITVYRKGQWDGETAGIISDCFLQVQCCNMGRRIVLGVQQSVCQQLVRSFLPKLLQFPHQPVRGSGRWVKKELFLALRSERCQTGILKFNQSILSLWPNHGLQMHGKIKKHKPLLFCWQWFLNYFGSVSSQSTYLLYLE